MLPLAVLWVDPGKMTGIASLTIAGQQPGHKFGADEFPFQEACSRVESWCSGWGQSLAIGWERFDINSQTHKKTQGGTKDALHVIGVLRYLTGKYGCRFLGEANQHTPGPHDQRQLRKLGWWVPGKDDAQSAACHMLAWLTRENELVPAWRDLLYIDK
jgi:hypothetical protein